MTTYQHVPTESDLAAIREVSLERECPTCGGGGLEPISDHYVHGPRKDCLDCAGTGRTRSKAEIHIPVPDPDLVESLDGEFIYLHAEDCPSFCDFACNGVQETNGLTRGRPFGCPIRPTDTIEVIEDLGPYTDEAGRSINTRRIHTLNAPEIRDCRQQDGQWGWVIRGEIG